ncbi:MAG: hypothetical protein QM479_16910 [Pseudomonadota bacterium]
MSKNATLLHQIHYQYVDLKNVLEKSISHYVPSNKNISIKTYKDYRLLIFNQDVVQTLIDIKQPSSLPFVLNQAILAVILFLKEIKTVCLVGTGGGAIARYLYAINPTIEGDAIEFDEAVIKYAKTFFDFPEQSGEKFNGKSNWLLHHADARRYEYRKSYSLIIIDLSEDHKTPNWITSGNHLKKIYASLKDDGIAVFNFIFENKDIFMQQLLKIRQQFGQRSLCFQVPSLNNIVVYAFKSPLNQEIKENITVSLDKKSKRWGIDFNFFYQEIISTNPIGSGIF